MGGILATQEEITSSLGHGQPKFRFQKEGRRISKEGTKSEQQI